MKPTLFLLMGLPGSGKTTAAKALEEVTGAARLSSDEERLKLWNDPTLSEAEHQALYTYLDAKTQELLQSGRSVVYDANLNRKQHREEKYRLAKQLGVRPILLYLQADQQLAKKRRLSQTTEKLVPKDETPTHMFERIAKIIEPPTDDEEHLVLDGTKITPEYVAARLSQHEAH